MPLMIGLVLAGVYFAAAKLGLKLAYIHASASAVWPPTGIALAAILLCGYRAWPAIFVGAFLANITTAGTLLTSLGIATGNTLEALAGAWCVTRYAGGLKVFETHTTIFKFMFFSGFVSTMISATLGAISLALGGSLPWENCRNVWLTWWLGDMMGALVVGPLCILWGLHHRIEWSLDKFCEALFVLLMLCIAGACVFGGLGDDSVQHYPMSFLCLPPLVWTALRFGPRETATMTAALSVIAIYGSVHGHGPFQLGSLNTSLLALQGFMGILGMTVLFLSSNVQARRRSEQELDAAKNQLEQQIQKRTEVLRKEIEERRHAQKAAQASELRLAEAHRLAHLGSWEWDIVNNIVVWSEELCAIHGLKLSDLMMSYENFIEWVHPEDRTFFRNTLDKAIQDKAPFDFEYRMAPINGTTHYLHGRGRVLENDKGVVTAVVGIAQDITERKQSNDSLLYASISQSAQVGLCAFRMENIEDDRTLTLIAANPAAVRITGLPEGSQIGRTLDEIAPGLRELGLPKRLAGVVRTRMPTDPEQISYGDSSIPQSTWMYRAFPMPNQCVGMTFENVSEQMRTMESLSKLASVVDYSDDSIISITSEGIITSWNRGAEEIFGYAHSEAVGRPVAFLAPPECLDEVRVNLEKIRRGERILHHETLRMRKDGKRIHVSLTLSPIVGLDGLISGASVIARDITEIKLADERFKQITAQWKATLDGALDAVITMDEGGRITDWNPKAERIFGWSREEIVGRSLAETLIPEDQRQAHVEGLAHYIATGEGPLLNRVVELRALRHDGSTFPAELSIVPIRSNGSILFSGFLKDISVRAQAQEKAKLYLDLAKNIQVGFAVCHLENTQDEHSLRLVDVNPAGLRLLHLTQEETLNKPMDEVAPGLGNLGVLRVLRDVVTRGVPTEVREIFYGDKRIPAVHWSFNAFPMPGQCVGIAFENINERKKSEEKFRLAVEAAPSAMIMVNESGSMVMVNALTERMFGYHRDELLGQPIEILVPERFRGQHPANRDSFFITSKAREMGAGRDLYALHRDGSEIPVEIGLNPIETQEGTFVLASIINITERKQSEERLISANEALLIHTKELAGHAEQMAVLNEFSSVLRATLNPREAYKVISQYGLKLLPEESGALFIRDSTGKKIDALSTWGDCPVPGRKFASDDCWALRRGHVHHAQEGGSVMHCGHMTDPPPRGYVCVPIIAWGDTFGILHFFNPVKPLSPAKEQLISVMTEHVALALANLRLQDKLRSQADRDPLTGLYNRRYMDKVLSGEIAKSTGKSLLCVAMVDLDHFKQFNDTHGHQAGDMVLQQVAALLNSKMRSRDIACRYGGEEFTLVLTKASSTESLQRIRQLQRDIGLLRMVHQGKTLAPLTASIGVAFFPEHGTTPRELLLAADSALYRAKTAGRNRVVVAKTEPRNIHDVKTRRKIS